MVIVMSWFVTAFAALGLFLLGYICGRDVRWEGRF